MKGSLLYSFLFVFLFLLFSIPFLYASAHGDSISYEEKIGRYTVDIGYSSENPEAGESVPFDFSLEENGARSDFDDVWVRIVSDEKTFFAGGIHNADFGGARMTYVFPEAGLYDVNFRFETGSDSLAEGSFPIVVSAGTADNNSSFSWVLYILLGAALGFFLSFVVKKSE